MANNGRYIQKRGRAGRNGKKVDSVEPYNTEYEYEKESDCSSFQEETEFKEPSSAISSNHKCV